LPPLAGCTVPEICAITGHSHEDANRIVQAHYLHRDPQIALERDPQVRGLSGPPRHRVNCKTHTLFGARFLQ
jgi:hypothetical protein